MAKKGGLGSGLNALFGETPPAAPATGDAQRPQTLPLAKIEPRADQPRSRFDADALDELTESIRQYGLIQPITVRPIDSGYYQIIAGERRWRAARAAGLTEAPVRILEADDRLAAELALVENLQREDLNPIEEARGYRALMEEYGLTQEEAAAAVGKSRSAVANALRLLGLGPEVLALVEEGMLSAGHARALLGAAQPETQKQLADAVIDRRLSVRQTEQLVARFLKERAAPVKTPADADPIRVDYVREVEKELEGALGRRVRLVDGAKKGRIEIEFYGAEDREKLIENLRLFSSLRRNK